MEKTTADMANGGLPNKDKMWADHWLLANIAPWARKGYGALGAKGSRINFRYFLKKILQSGFHHSCHFRKAEVKRYCSNVLKSDINRPSEIWDYYNFVAVPLLFSSDFYVGASVANGNTENV